ncbi:Gfo/Idh/MocA family protein [Nonomuraea pusilla]|uniref:Oxidoreductase family, C-terminal alpha/beta domain n=1 Tax=Nonomuraea pusilla TaxID=46177 RepID=A0A1H8FNP0_9ACTN|nr:Gfo/Idh/MocA family oxidoreductase [Nonomuraea pusilla]SEN33205.1 Oxidoreductase family, C-terminal alpha/beta domain [Nonomuraea pusilla]
MEPVALALVGAGNRGQTYASWVARHPGRARLVAVADPDPHRRSLVAAGHPGVAEHETWEDLLTAGAGADAVIIATQDREHREPAVALARAGHHLLLEKPLAPTEAECREIVSAVTESGVLFAVCHVLRYTPYTRLVKRVVDSGVLGEIMSVEHLEPVGWWHAAHSYVRGPWRSERLASPMLLAKSSHDLDWLSYVTGRRIARVASFGGLGHFRPDKRPAQAADRCLDCVIEPDCPYSAPKLYYPALRERGATWPVSVITDGADEAAVTEALRTGPYGRCVYACDNDVVDHQVLALEFDGGATGTFTMTAFTEQTHRQTRIFGSHGRLVGDGERVEVLDFRTGATETAGTGHESGSNAGDGHGGGDDGVMDAFVRAVATRDPSHISSGPAESLASHLAVFAAEQARHSGTVVTVPAR